MSWLNGQHRVKRRSSNCHALNRSRGQFTDPSRWRGSPYCSRRGSSTLKPWRGDRVDDSPASCAPNALASGCTLAGLTAARPSRLVWVANYYSARNPLRLSSLVILGVVARMFRCATRADGPRRPAVVVAIGQAGASASRLCAHPVIRQYRPLALRTRKYRWHPSAVAPAPKDRPTHWSMPSST